MGATVRLGVVLVMLLLAGCGGQAGGGQTAPPTGGGEPGEQQQAAPDDVVEPLREDAASRAGTDPGDVDVVVSERVTWPDGSLGCPQPGMSYTQALVEGYRVVLEAAGGTYDYRVPDTGDFVLCEEEQPGASPGP